MSNKFGNDKFGTGWQDANNRDLLEVIKKYQACPFVHPLTCGNESGHNLLKGVEMFGKVMLICPDCDYRQIHIPDFVWTVEEIDKAMEKDFNELYKAIKKDD